MRRYFMVNGPLGGNMGTPPVEPQPPQVSFTTTAESRGGFNNFLKSIPQTTAMTPIPPLGSAPTAPMSNPMGNIDIFNQPPSMGMGMMGINQPQMQQPMQPPMQQPMNMGVGLMGTPVQSFFDGGQVDDFGDFSSQVGTTASVASPTRSCTGGFYTGSYTNTIEYVEIMTTGNAIDFGDLTTVGWGYGASNGHGGL